MSWVLSGAYAGLVRIRDAAAPNCMHHSSRQYVIRLLSSCGRHANGTKALGKYASWDRQSLSLMQGNNVRPTHCQAEDL